MIGNNHNGVITTVEVSKRLGVTTRTVARLVETGTLQASVKLPGIRGAYLFDPAAVDAFKEREQ